ncbi:hypothetical protein C8J57DRAFT_1251773 [Mycena rebaudengoi]|nr:hypothetical protein C8J57DRAFT_1251773 [Mycena rebaudengoi]
MPPRSQKKKPRRKFKCVAKEAQKNLKLWAEGAREELVLRPHIKGYTDAMECRWRAQRDYTQDVCNEYHWRISWRLLDHEEPTLPLPEYDKSQRLRKPKKMDAQDPWAVLMAKLAGINSPPKARQAFQQYMHESYESEIAPVVAAQWGATFVEGDGALKEKRGPNAPFRSMIAQDLFNELTTEEQAGLKEWAGKEAKAAKEAYAAAMKAGPSKTPEARQRCIDNLGVFMASILTSDSTHLIWSEPWAPILLVPAMVAHSFQPRYHGIHEGVFAHCVHAGGMRRDGITSGECGRKLSGTKYTVWGERGPGGETKSGSDDRDDESHESSDSESDSEGQSSDEESGTAGKGKGKGLFATNTANQASKKGCSGGPKMAKKNGRKKRPQKPGKTAVLTWFPGLWLQPGVKTINHSGYSHCRKKLASHAARKGALGSFEVWTLDPEDACAAHLAFMTGSTSDT